MASLQGPLTEASLLRLILSWYARPSAWSAPERPGPYSGSSSKAKAVADSGRIAARACSAAHVGGLIVAACDAYDVALTDLARRAGMSCGDLQEIANGRAPTAGEMNALEVGLRDALATRP